MPCLTCTGCHGYKMCVNLSQNISHTVCSNINVQVYFYFSWFIYRSNTTTTPYRYSFLFLFQILPLANNKN